MIKDWVIASLKLLIVISLFFAPSAIIKRISPVNKIMSDIFPGNDDPARRRYYFLGSSRTMFSINDSVLNSRYTNSRFVNTGMYGCTFLFNKILADKLLNSGGKKTLFIELSVINARVPPSWRFVLNNSEVRRSVFPLMKKAGMDDIRHIFSPFLERITFSRARISPEIREILDPVTIRKQIGYKESREKGEDVSRWFAGNIDIPGKRINIHPLYSQIMNEIISKSKQTNSRILFYLSPVFGSRDEKETLTAIFDMIPAENK
jgi:hypothetical protein